MVLDGGFATVAVVATVRVVLSFPFLFILVESLKNHNKSQKNHKIENSILLDST
jgi:cell division protein FtsX